MSRDTVNLVPLADALANRIWAGFPDGENVGDEVSRVADLLCKAQDSADDENYNLTAYYLECAARDVFGDGSIEYAEIAEFFPGAFHVVRNGTNGAIGYF